MKAITALPFAAGLSNQKLALVGLILAAEAEGCRVALPPLLDQVAGEGCRRQRPVDDIFDLGMLREATSVDFVPLADIVHDPKELFHATMGVLQDAHRDSALLDHRAMKLLAAFNPKQERRHEISAAIDRFRSLGGSLVCQMRVEPDWVTYVEDRLSAKLGSTQDLTLLPMDIASKIAATFPNENGPVLITCDLAGLPHPARALADDIFDRFGWKILFKANLAAVSPSSLEASLFDFELMAQSDRMVGTTLSSFFGLAMLTHLARTGVAPEAWGYNALGPTLARRTDNGIFANIARATAR